MRILTYNLQGASNWSDVTSFVTRWKPDIVCLQEVGNPGVTPTNTSFPVPGVDIPPGAGQPPAQQRFQGRLGERTFGSSRLSGPYTMAWVRTDPSSSSRCNMMVLRRQVANRPDGPDEFRANIGLHINPGAAHRDAIGVLARTQARIVVYSIHAKSGGTPDDTAGLLRGGSVAIAGQGIQAAIFAGDFNEPPEQLWARLRRPPNARLGPRGDPLSNQNISVVSSGRATQQSERELDYAVLVGTLRAGATAEVVGGAGSDHFAVLITVPG